VTIAYAHIVDGRINFKHRNASSSLAKEGVVLAHLSHERKSINKCKIVLLIVIILIVSRDLSSGK
jgi:hypothetical protein